MIGRCVMNQGYVMSYKDLPKEVLNQISDRQKTYIDEFVFYMYETSRGKEYAAYYGGEFLCVWSNNRWNDKRS